MKKTSAERIRESLVIIERDMAFYLFKYLLATLKAKDGKMINTVTNKSLIKIWLITESGLFGPEAVRTTKMPIIPNTMDE